MTTTYSIRTLAREFDVTARTLRFYEAEGILHPERRGTTRLFSEQDRERLALALRGRRLGMSLEEIRGFIDLYDAEPREDARQTLQRLARIRAHRQQVMARIADANEALKAIDALDARVMAVIHNRNDAPDDGQLTFALG